MSTISPNALSLFFPNDQPTPTTVDHLLNLPPLINSFSPALASLHLARIRLGLLIPPGTFDQTAWCRTCGGLRQVVEAFGPSSPSPSPRKARGKKRSGVVKKRIVRPKECAICGTSFRGPKKEDTAMSFPPARTIRATRSNSANQAPATINVPYDSTTPPVIPSPTTSMDIDQPPEEPKSMMVDPIAIDPVVIQPDYHYTPRPPPPPKYVYNNGLTHVYTSAPNLPTYPQPPAQHVSPPPKEKNRKRKKSGLAKLLAENKEREGGAGGGSGSWGLE